MYFKLNGGKITARKAAKLPARPPLERRTDKQLLRLTVTDKLPIDRWRPSNCLLKGAGVPEGAQNTVKKPPKGAWGTCGGPECFQSLADMSISS